MTRTEIIAQLDAEIGRLERARDFLAAALTDTTTRLMRKVEKKLPAKQRKRTVVAAPAPAPVVERLNATVVETTTVPTPPKEKQEPQVQRLPPRRRMERRSLGDKAGRSPAALSGPVPTGPVVVSANEARKIQERAIAAPPLATVNEPRPEIGSERSLASLIQAFERRTGMNGIETP